MTGTTLPLDPIALERRRLRRPWIIGFIVYALLLTVATHWPRLALGSETRPVADKLIHLYAFGGLTFLLWRTGWIRSRRLVLGIALVWTLLDELTQALPGLGREFSWQDVVAGWLGVGACATWLAVLRPIGGRANRTRLRAQVVVFEELFTHWQTWALATAAAGPVGAAALFIWPIVYQNIYLGWPQMLYAAGHMVWLGLLGLFWLKWWQAETARFAQSVRCLGCGTSCRDVPSDDRGEGNCPTCGEAFHTAQWLPPAPLPREGRRRALVKSVLIAGVVMIVFAVIGFAVSLRLRRSFGAQVLTVDMVNAIDLALLAVAIAIGTIMLRRWLADAADRQHRICRVCGHDLRETPVSNGLGTCGECGVPFGAWR